MSADLLALPGHVQKDFFELMRRVESLQRARQTQQASSGRQDHSVRRAPPWLTIEQSAELVFAPGEVASIALRTAPLDPQDVQEVVVRQRHFGLFAPYGPLPLYVTEHAFLERMYERNTAFERFINMVSARLAWNHYCAWSALHPVLACERPRNAFAERLGHISSAPRDGQQAQGRHDHAGACRAAFAGVYACRQRPLAPLRRMLARYFNVGVRVLPRTGRWMAVPNRGTDPRRLGQWRVGSRVQDAQLQTQIVVGPLDATAFQQWKRKSACVAAMAHIANDYADGAIQPLILVQIRTSAAMAARVGAMHLGHDAWAHPGEAIQTLTVYDAFQEPQ